jgi:AcrR family transcriptional regulator
MSTAKPAPRRTQDERRAATREVLMQAAIASLVHDGYSGTTTRAVARRAGVSHGALQHHYATKSALVVDAMRHAMRRLGDEARERLDITRLDTSADRELAVDELWRLHTGDAFRALQELTVAAGTDAELRDAMRELAGEMLGDLASAPAAMLPDEGWDERRLDYVGLVLASVRGIAMLAPLLSDDELAAMWARSRRRLLELIADAR